MEALHTRIAAIIGELAGVRPESIGPGTCLGDISQPNRHDPLAQMKPLELDSLDRVDLMMRLENEFRIQIADEEVDACDSHVGAVVELVADKLDHTPLELREADKRSCPACGR